MFRFLLSLSLMTSVSLIAAPEPRPFQHPVVFEPNHGQAPTEVKWIARASGYRLLFTDDGATIVLPDVSEQPGTTGPQLFQLPTHAAASSKPTYSPVRMKLTGGNPWSKMEGLEPTGGVSNYLLGSDPNEWRMDIPHHARLTASQVYDGIDLVFYSDGSNLEYDFIVAPGADPKQVRLAFDGVDRLRVDDKSGDLILTIAGGAELRHLRPKVYQQEQDGRVEVAGAYEILDRRQATFALASYDRRRPLVIDPTIAFTTFLTATDVDVVDAQAVDAAGNVYVTGSTNSTNFPLVEAFQGDQPFYDAFVTKLSPTGAILFSTYLGGNFDDNGRGIAVDSTGIYLTGDTNSTTFPVKNTMFPNRSMDAFVTKLNLNGNALIYSSYLGGSKYDYPLSLALDSTRAVWVVGQTDSADFPIAGGPIAGQQRKYAGNWDGFMARVAPDGLSITFSTFVGSPGYDRLRGVKVDRSGSVYATGHMAKGFSVTTGMKPCGNDGGAVVVRLKGPGTQSRFATCLGPGEGTGITVDTNFNSYITGYTPGNFPTTAGVFQRNNPAAGPGIRSGFVTKLGPLGRVAYSTYLGGNYDTAAEDIAIDASGAVYVVGYTASTEFPGVPPDLDQSGGFLSKLMPQAKSLAYSMILGEGISDVTMRGTPAAPQIYVAGFYNVGFNYDSFVMKLE